MNILIDIGHPAHVHYYRNLAKELNQKGHSVYWTAKKDPLIHRLLRYYQIEYQELPGKSDHLIGKIARQVFYNTILWELCMAKRIDLAIGTSVSIAHVSRLSRVKSIVFDDDDDAVQPMITRFVNPYATVLVSPDSLIGRRKRKDTLFYPGFHELAYLHPNWFVPDPTVLEEIGLSKRDRFVIMRFNAFKAHHDTGSKGLSLTQKLRIIDRLASFGKIFITSERELEKELMRYQLSIHPEKIHSLMYYANLFVGDSQTMTTEAAMLGIPSLRCNSFAGRIANLEVLEHRYGLTYGYTPDREDALMKKLDDLIGNQDLKKEWRNRRYRMLSDKIDVTAFWTWLIDRFPTSLDIIRSDPAYPNTFR